MNLFLVKYLVCGVGLPDVLKNDPRVKTYRVEATASPDNPSGFWAGVPKADRESYNQFAEEIVRIEAVTDQHVNVFYLAFRSGRELRPDLGPNKHTLAKPSSVELGYCPGSKQGYVSLWKKHYSDYGPLDDQSLAHVLFSDLRKIIATSIK